MSDLFTARPIPSRRPLVLTVALVAFFTLWHTFGAMFGAVATTEGTISGVVFHDANRDGMQQAGEAPMHLALGVYDSTGARLDAAYNDPDTGKYSFTGLPATTLTVMAHPVIWHDFELDWVPTTNEGLHPEHTVDLAASSAVTRDFGLREIVRSSDVDAPLSSATTPHGTQVDSYNDAVPAEEIADQLGRGSLFGGEAPRTVVRFDLNAGEGNFCASGVSGAPGSYSGFDAECWITYGPWLSMGDRNLFHEYGHAVTKHAMWIVNQTDNFDAYLEARGLLGDTRLNSSTKWTAGEMIAEDYRQLFGSPTAAAWPLANADIPAATAVEGLREFFHSFVEAEADADTSADTDTTAPELSGVIPGGGTTVSGTTELSVQATDETTSAPGLTVTFLMDGRAHDAAYDSSVAAWTATVDTTAIADGAVTLEARATDAAGNTGSVSHQLLVDNGADSTEEPTTETPTASTTVVAVAGSTSNKGSWFAWVDVTVTVDGRPADRSTVNAYWSGGGKHGGSGVVSCTTDDSGMCRLRVEQPNRVPSVTFAIEASAGSATALVHKP